jgi:hypothetical protein
MNGYQKDSRVLRAAAVDHQPATKRQQDDKRQVYADFQPADPHREY